MRRLTTALLAAALVVGTGQAEAQDRNDESWWTPAVISLAEQAMRVATTQGDGPWWERQGRTDRDDRYERRDDRYDRDDRYERDGRRGEARRGGNARKGNGPPFCRNGSGHPVHGMKWCVDKGWAGGAYDRYGSDRDWARTTWEDVIFGDRAPERGERRERRVRQSTIGDILGGTVLGRLADHGQQLGLKGEVDGRWVPTRVGSVLQIRMGGTPLAELTDADRDGKVDVVLLRRR